MRKILLSLLCLCNAIYPRAQSLYSDSISGLKQDCESDIVMYLTPRGVENKQAIDLSKYPKWDLTEKFLQKDWAKLTQGTQGSCTAFTVAFAITIQRNIDNYLLKKSQLVQFSPSFVFNQAKSRYTEPYKSSCKDGISFIDAFLVVRDFGIPLINEFVYVPKDNGCTVNIPETVYKRAKDTKIAIFQRPFRTVDNFKRILVDVPYYPICIAAYVGDEYENARINGGRWTKVGIASGRAMHAMLIVGFDEGKHAFKVMDWQGPNRGDKGFIWLDYDLIGNPAVIFDAYICSHQMEYLDPRIGNSPAKPMDENKDRPGNVVNNGPNSEFKDDKISFWIKSGYFTIKNIFRISCNYVSDADGRATFRITNNATGELIADDLVLDESKSRCFNYDGIDYNLRLVEIAHRGKNIFKKAAVLRFTRNSTCK